MKKNSKWVEGIFHKLSEEIRVSLVKMCIKYVSVARASDLLALSKILTAKIRKEEILCDKTVLAVSEKYIDALYYNEMFYSMACWNTDTAVDRVHPSYKPQRKISVWG